VTETIVADNVERARCGYEAIARGDIEAVQELMAPDVRWHGGDPTAPGACRNRPQALRFMRRALAAGLIGRLVDVVDFGDSVVVIMQPPPVGGRMPPRRANVTTFRDGLVVEIVAYESPAAALAAARAGCYHAPQR
jgi:ketosteroid isomerase-like protein